MQNEIHSLFFYPKKWPCIKFDILSRDIIIGSNDHIERGLRRYRRILRPFGVKISIEIKIEITRKNDRVQMH